MSQVGAWLRCRTSLSPGLAPRAPFQVAVPSVVQANMDRFHVCHGAGLPKSATISGQVLVTFAIEPDGHVSGPRVRSRSSRSRTRPMVPRSR